MNKQDLIASIHAKSQGASKASIEFVLTTLGEVTAQALNAGEEITLPGIGKLTAKAKPARKGRNPSTGEEIDIPAKHVPHFSAAKALKDAVNR